MTERLKFQGRLAEKKLEAKRLELRLTGLREAIRNLLDPFEELKALDCEVVAEQALELASLHTDYRAALDEIAAIKKALGK